MSKEITLPSGATVTMRDPRTLKQKDRAKLYDDADGQATVKTGMNIMSKLIAILVEDWSFDLVPPAVKIDSLGELEIADYDALLEEAEAAMPVLWPKLAQTTETEADPKAPTAS
jgi:hypothetical protein